MDLGQEQIRNAINEWTVDNNGHCPAGVDDYKYHALRLLNEAVELCLATGANERDIQDTVNSEITKEMQKANDLDALSLLQGRGVLSLENIPQEMADVQILLEILAWHSDISLNDAVKAKLQVLQDRKFEPDEHGVLWRKQT